MGKRKWGDRRDAKLIRDIDAMHYIMPLMYPNRCDNEAFMTLHINLENYVGIDRTILTLAQFAFILLHKTQEYKFNVYTGIRDYLNKEVDLADLGAFYKIKNVFGYPKVFGSSAIQDILEKSSFIGYFNTDRFKEAIDNTFVDYCTGVYGSSDAALADMEAKLNEIL